MTAKNYFSSGMQLDQPQGFHQDGGSDDSDMDVWDESEVAAVESSIRESRRSTQETSQGPAVSTQQWTQSYFRPGTAPEVSLVQGLPVSSPPDARLRRCFSRASWPFRCLR